jgi:hypothetical protein
MPSLNAQFEPRATIRAPARPGPAWPGAARRFAAIRGAHKKTRPLREGAAWKALVCSGRVQTAKEALAADGRGRPGQALLQDEQLAIGIQLT